MASRNVNCPREMPFFSNSDPMIPPVQANAVFAQLPEKVAAGLHSQGWHFYDFIGEGGARFMCSWQTTDAAVDDLVAAVREAAA
jgi:threonine aldolase